VINLESGVHWERLTAGSDPSPTRRAPRPATKTRSFATGAREYGYVISGRLGVRIGFDEYELGPGMAISFDSSSPHRLWAIGDQPAEAIWVVVGRQNPPGAH